MEKTSKICKDERNDLWMVKMTNRNLQVSRHVLSRQGGAHVAEQVQNLFFSPVCSVSQGTAQAPAKDGESALPLLTLQFSCTSKPNQGLKTKDRTGSKE